MFEPSVDDDLSALYDRIDKLNELRLESFDIVYTTCIKSMKNVADTGKLACFFAIPKLIIGYPLIDPDICAEYIYEKFDEINKSGRASIRVRYFKPNILLICWAK
jgi:hypothetical protein